MRAMAWLLGGSTLLMTGIYTLVYLNRWEWNRALFVGMLFVAVEVGMASSIILRRIARLERRMLATRSEPAALARIRETGPTRDHFAWLEPTMSRTNVFVTVLLGAGVVLSALTWLIDRVAGKTAVPTLEHGLASRLEPLRFPHDVLVPDDAELLAQGGPYEDDPSVRILLGPHP